MHAYPIKISDIISYKWLCPILHNIAIQGWLKNPVLNIAIMSTICIITFYALNAMSFGRNKLFMAFLKILGTISPVNFGVRWIKI